MMTERNASLLEKALQEEKNYNWIKVRDLYIQMLENINNKGATERIASLYKKLGYINAKAADTVENLENYVELKKTAIESYIKASEFFKLKNCKAEELESRAESHFESSLIKSSIKGGKEDLDNALDLFIQASELYLNKGDKESYAKNLIRATIVIFYLMNYIIDWLIICLFVE